MTALDVGSVLGRVSLETIEFDRVYNRTVTRMRQLGTQAASAAGGVGTLDEALTATGTSSTRAAAGIDKAAVANRRAAAASDQHALAVTRVGQTMTFLSGATDRERAATLRAMAAQERYDAVLASGTASTKQLATAQAGLISSQRAVAAAQKSSAVAAGGFRSSLGGVLHTARDLGVVFGAIEIARKVIEFVGAGKELTTALNSVQSASHATDHDMKAVRAQVIALGKDMTVPAATAVDAAEAIDDLVRAGMTLPRAMGSARAALLLAAAANTDTADSARVLGDVLDEFKLSAGQATKTASILAGAATSSAGGLMAVFQAFTYVGTRARALGLGVQDIAAAIVDLSKAGINADRAGTGMAMMFQKLADNSPKTERALKTLGVAAFDATGQFVGLPKIIDDLHAAQKRLNPEQFIRAISQAFGARAANVVAAFALRGVEGYDKVYKRLSSGDVEAAAALMNRGVTAGFRQLGKEATAAGIDIYQNFEPQVSAAIMWLGKELPAAAHVAGAVLGGPLSAAWDVVSAGIRVVGDVLGPVLHLLESINGPLAATATGALAVWAGFRLFSAIPGILDAVALRTMYAKDAVVGFGASAAASSRAAVGAFTATGAAATATGGEIAAAGTVARVGWRAMLGPLGAIALGITAVVSLFNDSSDASKAAAQAITDSASKFKEAFGEGPGGIRAEVVSQLVDHDLPALVKNLNLLANTHFDVKSIYGAVVGGGAPLNNLDKQLDRIIAKNRELAAAASRNAAAGSTGAAFSTGYFTDIVKNAEKAKAAIDTVSAGLVTAQTKEIAAYKTLGTVAAPVQDIAAALELTSGEVTKYAGVLGLTVTKNGDLVNATEASKQAILRVATAYNTATSSGSEFLNALQTFSQSAGTSADRAAIIGATLRAANGDALSYAAAINGAASASRQLFTDVRSNAKTAKESIHDYVASVVDLKTGTIDYHRAAAGPLISDLQQIQSAALTAAQAQYQHSRATMSGKAAADAAYKTYVGQTRGALLEEATKLGLTRGEAKKLADQYFGMPKKVKTLIEQQGGNPVVTVLNRIGEQLAILTGHPWNVDVTTTYHQIGQMPTNIGSKVKDPRLRASGGPIFGPGTETSDSIPIMGSNNEHMVSAREVRGLGGHAAVAAIRAAGRAGRRVPGFAAGGAITTSKTDGKKVWVFGGQQYASARAAENAQARAQTSSAKKQNAIEVEIRTKDIPGFIRALGKTTSELISAERTLSKAAKQAGASQKTLAAVARTEKTLNALSRARAGVAARLGSRASAPTAYDQLAAAQSNYAGEKSNVAGTINSGFDLASAGRSSGGGLTLASLLGDAGQQRSNAELFNRQLDKLKAKGLGGGEYAQLAEKGFAGAESSVLALLGASRAQIKQLNSTVAALHKAASGTGTRAADDLFGGQVSHAQGTVDRLRTREHNLDVRMKHLADRVEYRIQKDLGWVIDSNGSKPGTGARMPGHHHDMPRELVVIDEHGILLGRMRVAAREEAHKQSRATARALNHHGGRV